VSFPAPLQTVRLTLGPVLSVDGSPRPGELLVLRTTETLRVAGSGSVLPSQIAAYTDATGTASVEVLATDSVGVDRSGWTYRLTAPGIPEARLVALPASAPEARVEDLVPTRPASGETVWLPDELIRDLAEIASAAVRAEAAVGEADAHAELAERYAADAVGAATTAAGAASTATDAAHTATNAATVADSAATRSAAVLDEILAYEPPTSTPGDGAAPGFLFLGEDEEVPAGTKPGTLIFRSAAIVGEPELGLSIVTSGAETFTAEGTSFSIARPTGLAVGDLLLVALTHQASSTTTEPFLAPSGFVRLSQDSQFPTPDGYRPTALYALPIVDEATLAAAPATMDFTMKPEFGFGRAAAVAFRVTGADLDAPLAGSTGFTSASSPTTVPLKPLTSETADGVELALFASQATGGRVPDVSIDGMTREFVVNMTAATGSTTSLVVFSAPMTSTAAPSRAVVSTIDWANAGAASVALRRKA